MVPRLFVQVHHRYDHSFEVVVPVTSSMIISRETAHKPLTLHITRAQLQVAADDKINVEFPRGVPNSFGHIDRVESWRLRNFKFTQMQVLLDGRPCKLPLKVVSRTQRFLNDMVAPDLSRVCLVLFDGKQPQPPRFQQVDLDMNKDEHLLNLIGAYKSEHELWSAEVCASKQGRTAWYGSSEHNAQAVAVDPSGLIHAATALVLGEEKCRVITGYPLDMSDNRTLLLQDAQRGMKWICDNMFRMCPPQRLNKGLRFSVMPFAAVGKSARTGEGKSSVASDGDQNQPSSDSDSDSEGESDGDSELVYDDADRFNMSVYSDQEERERTIGVDWPEWLRALGSDASGKPHVLQVTAVAQMSLRACVRCESFDEPVEYPLGFGGIGGDQ